MILLPISHVIHYKCAFNVLVDNIDVVESVKNNVVRWLSDHRVVRTSGKMIDKDWYIASQSDQASVGDGYVRVAVNKGSGSLKDPDNWAIEFIHNDSVNMSRIWCTDICLSNDRSGKLRFVCMLRHAIKEGWIGELPGEPSFSVPNIVKTIVNDYSCSIGGSRIQSKIHECYVGDPSILGGYVQDVNRRLPLIVSSPDEEGNDSVDLGMLQQIVLGNANVYYLKYDDILNFNRNVPHEYSMRPGMVRVYQKFSSTSSNPRSHRFYTSDKIKQIGSSNLLQQVGVALSRNARTFLVNEPLSVRDVIHLRGMYKIKYDAKSQENCDEIIKLYENEVSDLRRINDEERQSSTMIAAMFDEIEEELKREKAKLYRIESEQRETNPESSMDSFAELPDSVESCLKIIEKMFGSRLIIHDDAVDSALEFSGNKDIGCVCQAWQMLYYTATVLHDIVFSKKTYDIEQEFKKRTGIDYSKTEGSSTKKDKKLSKLRKCQYNGKEYKCNAHMKGRKQQGHIRIHVAIVKEESKIMICHCGEHLETYGTRKMS